MGYEYVTIRPRHRSMSRGAQDVSDTRTELLDLIVDPDAAYDRPPADLAPASCAAARRAVRGAAGADPAARQARRRRRHRRGQLVRRPGAAAVRPHRLQVLPAVVLRQGPVGPDAAVARHPVRRRRVRRRRRPGVTDVDDWIERLWDAGHAVARDERLERQVLLPQPHAAATGLQDAALQVLLGAGPSPVPTAITPTSGSGRRPAAPAPSRRPHFNAENWGRPGRDVRAHRRAAAISDVSRDGRLPQEDGRRHRDARRDRAIRAEAARKGRTRAGRRCKLTEKILDHRRRADLPERHVGAAHDDHRAGARARHRRRRVPPATASIDAGGGVKGVALPPDYKEQVARFYGDVVRPAATA